MSGPDDTETTPVKKPTKRKRAKVRRAAPAKASATETPAEFAGLTVTECCKTCSAEGCAISGKNYCAHPRKGGLQAADMGNHEALGRLNAAVRVLGVAALEKKYA